MSFFDTNIAPKILLAQFSAPAPLLNLPLKNIDLEIPAGHNIDLELPIGHER